MIGLLRRGDDGATDRQRHRAALKYEAAMQATAADFARARSLTSRALARNTAVVAPGGRQGAGTTSLLTSPQQGPDAAGAVLTPLTGLPPKHAGTGCIPGFVCDHTGHGRDACLADHWALMARLNTYVRT